MVLLLSILTLIAATAGLGVAAATVAIPLLLSTVVSASGAVVGGVGGLASAAVSGVAATGAAAVGAVGAVAAGTAAAVGSGVAAVDSALGAAASVGVAAAGAVGAAGVHVAETVGAGALAAGAHVAGTVGSLGVDAAIGVVGGTAAGVAAGTVGGLILANASAANTAGSAVSSAAGAAGNAASSAANSLGNAASQMGSNMANNGSSNTSEQHQREDSSSDRKREERGDDEAGSERQREEHHTMDDRYNDEQDLERRDERDRDRARRRLLEKHIQQGKLFPQPMRNLRATSDSPEDPYNKLGEYLSRRVARGKRECLHGLDDLHHIHRYPMIESFVTDVSKQSERQMPPVLCVSDLNKLRARRIYNKIAGELVSRPSSIDDLVLLELLLLSSISLHDQPVEEGLLYGDSVTIEAAIRAKAMGQGGVKGTAKIRELGNEHEDEAARRKRIDEEVESEMLALDRYIRMENAWAVVAKNVLELTRDSYELMSPADRATVWMLKGLVDMFDNGEDMTLATEMRLTEEVLDSLLRRDPMAYSGVVDIVSTLREQL
jgi:hypothetical protein